MLGVTGADLPSETLLTILSYLFPGLDLVDGHFYSSDKRRQLKHGLSAPSLVCKYWSEAIRPILFRVLELRSAADVQLLENIVCNTRFTTSSLFKAIERIEIHQEATKAKPWLHYVHGLSN